MGSWPGKNVLTKVSLTMAAPGEVSCRAKVAAGNEGDLHRREPAGGNVQEKGGSRTGRRAVDGDVAVDLDASEKGPARDGDRVDAGGSTERLGSLIPDDGELAFAGNGFKQEQTVGGETEGAVLRGAGRM